jgi:DNA ligase-1
VAIQAEADRVRPMLAVEAKELVFPLYASTKIDGVRAIIKDQLLLSRSLKPIPNEYVQDLLGQPYYEGLDGELTVGAPNDANVMQATTSGVMSRDGQPDFTFWVFDYWTCPSQSYEYRLSVLTGAFRESNFPSYINLLPQILVRDKDELLHIEEDALQRGYEGLILRSKTGIYKYGRSTAREGYLLKLKRFTDAEAVVIGFEELLHNGNTLEADELGYAKRSSHKDGKVPMNMLGALKVRDQKSGIEFSIGTGFVLAERRHIWEVRDNYLGKLAVYKSFEIGVKVAPRFPVFKGFRNVEDL